MSFDCVLGAIQQSTRFAHEGGQTGHGKPRSGLLPVACIEARKQLSLNYLAASGERKSAKTVSFAARRLR